MTAKRAAFSFIDDVDFIDKSSVIDTALKVLASYRERVELGEDKKSDLKEDPAQLIQRVQNNVVNQIAEGIRENYDGEFYIWLPSDAEEPDPEHQLNYGKKFQIGDGEMPGDRYGCRCGMEILVKENKLEL